MTDPIGTAQELIERDLDALRYVLNFADSNSRVSTIMRTFQLPDRVTTEERLERLYATVQSRIAEVGRLETLLMEAATELDQTAQSVVDAASRVGVPTKYAGRKVTSETGDRIRAALSLHRRPT